MFEYDQEVNCNYAKVKTDDLNPSLAKSINRIIKSEGYLTYSIYVANISTEGGNYMSLLKEVDIRGKTINSNKETNLFIKRRLPVTDKDVICTEELFCREIFIYTELEDLFDELQNEFKVPDNEKYKFVKFYGNDNADALIFDNMVKKGFKIYDRFEVVTLKALEISVKQLAKFHSFSTVLKKYKPDFYSDKIQTKNHVLQFSKKEKQLITSLWHISLGYLEDERKIKIEKYMQGLIEKHNHYLNVNDRKFKCLCHGDYRMNNILVKEKNKEAAEIIPIDYQLIYHGSPVIDLIYLIFMATDQQFRKIHMEHLKMIYYDSFAKFLRYFKIDADSVYPREDYEDDFKSRLDYGIITSMVYLPFVFGSEDDVPEVNDELKTMKLHDKFKPRLEEIVDDFTEWGYL